MKLIQNKIKTRDFYEGIARAIISITMLKNDNNNDGDWANHENSNNCDSSNYCNNGNNHDKPNMVGHTFFS